MLLTADAIEGFKKYTERTIAHATYKIGDETFKVPIHRKERLSDGKVAIYFSIIPQSNSTVTINEVCLYDTNGKPWAIKSENIEIDNVQEGILYRFTFDLKEQEV